MSRDPESRLPEAPAQPAGPQAGYQENTLLVLLLIGGLFCLLDIRMLALVAVISALVVYADAVSLRAGEKFEKESLLGTIAAWRPATWAVTVLVVPLVFLAIYTFSREEIFNANA